MALSPDCYSQPRRYFFSIRNFISTTLYLIYIISGNYPRSKYIFYYSILSFRNYSEVISVEDFIFTVQQHDI